MKLWKIMWWIKWKIIQTTKHLRNKMFREVCRIIGHKLGGRERIDDYKFRWCLRCNFEVSTLKIRTKDKIIK